MLSYKTPASLKAENAEAAKIMAQHDAKPYSHVKVAEIDIDGKLAPQLKRAADLLASRKRG